MSERRDQRIGYYSHLTGNPKQVARTMGFTPRMARFVANGDRRSLPQHLAERIDRYCDGPASPLPLVAGQVERILYRWGQRLDRGEILDLREQACEREATKQGKVDLLQLCLRTQVTPESLADMARLAPVQAVALLELAAYSVLLLEEL